MAHCLARGLGLLGEPGDLLAVEEQLAGALGCMIAPRSELVLRDVDISQPDLTIINRGECLCQRHTPQSEGFHLSTGQYQPSFIGLPDLVVVSGLLILSDERTSGLSGHSAMMPRRGLLEPAGHWIYNRAVLPGHEVQVTAC